MLLLDQKTREIEGVTVYPDHARADQFYYMPLSPRLSTRREGEQDLPVFSLIGFKGEANHEMTGGFVNFDVDLGLPPEQYAAIKSQLEREAGVEISLAPIPVVDGSVHLIMLDKDSSTPPPEQGEETEAPDDQARFVTSIYHAAKPSLYGDNRATFSVSLTQYGYSAVEQSLESVILPIAVVYSLQYIGLRPAYSVYAQVDWDRVQKHMDQTFKVDALFVSTEISKVVDELVEKRFITFNVDDFTTGDPAEASASGRLDAAVGQVRGMITDAFFQPSLPPWKPDDASGWAQDLKKVADVISMIAAGPAAAHTSKTLFSYKSIDYKRTDRKQLNVNFSERVAIRRSIYPQGHLAGLLEPIKASGVPMERFVTQVDLDDPWFKRRRVNFHVLADFVTDKIQAINIRARYNGEPKNIIVTGLPETPPQLSWASRIENNRMVMPVDVQYDITFKDVDANERPHTLQSPVVPVDNENAEIDPRTIYSMAEVPIRIDSDFPFNRYSSVDVNLRYTEPNSGLAETEMFTLTQALQTTSWTVFVIDKTAGTLEYRLLYRGAGHPDFDAGWRTVEDEQVYVSDPFPDRLKLKIVPTIDWTQYRSAFVEVSYQDGGRVDRQSVDFVADTGNQTVFFEAEDPTWRVFSYSGMIIGNDGRSIEIPESQSSRSIVQFGPESRGHRVIEVRPPVDFHAQRLRKATAELTYLENDVAKSKTFVFEPGGTKQLVEYDFTDPTKATYSGKFVYLYENGLKKSVEKHDAEDPFVQLAAP